MSFKVVPSQADMAEELEAIQRACFPSLAVDELITAAHFRAQIEVFPEGQLAVIDDKNNIVACSTDMRTSVDWQHIEHRYIDKVDQNWLGTHEPKGDWLYGVDIGVHPKYRRRGLSKLLYRTRHKLVRRLGLKGHVAGGLLVGYYRVKQQMSVERYVAKLKQGQLFDPTVSVQLRRGFEIHGIIHNYVDDPSCDNKAALIVWRNPDYQKR